MAQIAVRLGTPADVDAAVAVYERSNLARRHGVWPSRSTRVAAVAADLHDAASWIERRVYFDRLPLLTAILLHPRVWRGSVRYRFGRG